MTTPADIKQQVRQFYDQVGWQEVSEGTYQNAHYEDLRPVAREYIHRCHLRVKRHIKTDGRFLLDAGSGPIQYPEYLEYSQGYRYRVCADISIQALQEARKRIGEHGLFVVADIANLPFAPGVFEGVVSLHTIHHLPEDEHLRAYLELYRVLSAGERAVVVNGWPESRLMKRLDPMVKLGIRLRNLTTHLAGRERPEPKRNQKPVPGDAFPAKGTFINRHGAEWLKGEVGGRMPVEIRVWRSVSVRFTRSLIHRWLGGRYWLRLLYRLEERSPRWFGENGQYPLIIICKGSE
jgi:SAM-dependent methyltransferase